MHHLERKLDDYFDRCFIYIILLDRAGRYFNILKILFKLPIILSSSVMSIVNSNITSSDDNDILRIVNIIVNILTALSLSLSAYLKIEERAAVFQNTERKFFKLSSIIEQKLMNSEEELTVEFLKSIIDQYEIIVESLEYNIPAFICKKVRAQYATKKTLPLIINGIRKQDIYRSPNNSFKVPLKQNVNSSLYYDNNNMNIPKVIRPISIIYDKNEINEEDDISDSVLV